MKKKLSMLLVALLCVGLMAGCGQSTDEDKKEDTTKQEQQADNQDSGDNQDSSDNQDGSDKAGDAAGDLISEDIVLSGTYYSGQVQVTVTIHPDGTALMVANGTESEGTWEAGSGDVFITAHFDGEQATDLDITEEDGVYTAPFATVPGMTLQGR